MIALEPVGGLCNRLRAIDSAIALAKDLDQELRILWTRHKDIYARFFELFDPIESERVKLFELNPQSVHPLSTLKLDKAIKPSDFSRLLSSKYDFRDLAKYKNICITSFSRFYRNPQMYSDIHPNEHIRQLIDAETAVFAKNTIGVHIRRTDNARSMAESPVEAFCRAIDKLLQEDSSMKFYLASDCLEVKKKMVRNFGDNIITNLSISERTNLEGIVRAVIELYALSETQLILGSYWSSFSTTAANLGKITEVTIRK